MALKFLNDGYFAGKVGIGTESPQTGVKLDVRGNVRIGDGSSAEQDIHFNNSTTEWQVGTNNAGNGTDNNQFYFYEGGNYRLTVQKGGNVGIGTTSPGGKLEVDGTYGDLKIGDPSVGTQITYYDTTRILMNSTDIKFYTNSLTERMTIESNGNVGIGTTSPSNPLTVVGVDSIGIDDYILHNGDSNTKFGFPSNDTFKIRTSGVDRLNINSSGNVGIGTTSPGTRLHVVGSNMIFKVENASTTTNDYSQMLLQAGTATNYIWTQNQNSTNYGGAYSLNIYTQQAGPIAFFTNGNNERMRITSTGNVGIGRSTSITAALFVEGPADTSTISTSSTPAARINNGGAISNWIGSNGYNYGYIQSIQDDGSNNLKHLSLNPLGGNVGIGETNPSEKLHMNNTTDTGCFIRFQNTGGSGVYIGGRSEDMEMYTNGTLKMAIGSNGSVKFNSYNNANQTGTPTYLLGTDGSGNVVKTNTVPGSAAGPYLPLAGGTMTGTNGVLMPDNFKLKFGDATTPDLEIYHNGTNSFIETSTSSTGDLYIKAQGTGNELVLQATDDILIRPQGGENGIKVHGNDSVELYFNNVRKLRTTSGGVFVEGEIKIDSALLDNQENTDVDTGTETVANVAIATYTAAFFDFVIKKTTNVRSGTVYACHDGTNVEFTETSTQDLGDTSDVTLSVDISGGNMRLLATTTSDDWSVKSLIRAI